MIGQTISHFRIIEKLGGGGMGVVYKAQDTKLDRPVALKFLPLHLAHGREEKQRFVHEAKAASALDHPNICTIYEIDETPEGQMFIAMACYEGESLKKRIDREVPSVEETVQIGNQIAKGLAKAHQQGIVHRDIKPANIMITRDGTVKIVDFGLAKLAGQTRLTRSGTALGTVAYMSPEQARGEEIGAETDIWALGVVLYEMLTGRRPFEGDRDQAVIYSILKEGPRPISGIRTGVPPELQQAVEKALQKRPDQRHHDMEAFSTSLGAVARQVPGLLTTQMDSRTQVLPSIAVLPFTNMSADPEQEYFCDGMAEEIINALVKVEGLRVAARTSAFAFKDKREDIREIGRKLNVNKVLEGSVRKGGARLRVTAQLIDVANGYHLWSQRYDREMEDVFAIQDEISRAIVNALKVELRITVKEPLVKRPTSNLAAYDAYLQGIYCYKRRTKADNDQAIELFQKATALDPAFAVAFAALAYAHIETFFTYQPQKEWEKRAFVAIEKALSVNPELAEAHVAKGLLLWTKSRHFPHEKAIAEYRRAIALNPNLAQALAELARVLWHIGLLDDAYQALQKAMDLDPKLFFWPTRVGKTRPLPKSIWPSRRASAWVIPITFPTISPPPMP